MQVSAIQFDFIESESFDVRVERILSLVVDEAEADLVVLPELWPNGGFTYQLWQSTAQPLSGELVHQLQAAARSASVVLHGGSFIERHDDGSLTNTAVVVERDGSLNAVYRKIHLFGFTEGEPKYLVGGHDVVVADTSVGKLGLATCYDLRFPEMFRALTDAGSDVFVVPAAWPASRIAHWSVLARARAIENQLPLIALNTAGAHGGVPMGSASLIVDAMGLTLAEAGESEQVIRAELDFTHTRDWRERFPALGDRRL
ncbi:MAG: carbon-nitrogen family hydrolase [Actinomycetia bacterium]|nr:carbon-nitrogen family hydrolase [Actinomycetes bacterium]